MICVHIIFTELHYTKAYSYIKFIVCECGCVRVHIGMRVCMCYDIILKENDGMKYCGKRNRITLLDLSQKYSCRQKQPHLLTPICCSIMSGLVFKYRLAQKHDRAYSHTKYICIQEMVHIHTYNKRTQPYIPIAKLKHSFDTADLLTHPSDCPQSVSYE